jgi:hypothetical protein
MLQYIPSFSSPHVSLKCAKLYVIKQCFFILTFFYTKWTIFINLYTHPYKYDFNWRKAKQIEVVLFVILAPVPWNKYFTTYLFPTECKEYVCLSTRDGLKCVDSVY